MKSKHRTLYYEDERNDDFAEIQKKSIDIDANFEFVPKNPLKRLLSFLVYRLIMTPFAFVYCKLKFRYKIVGKEKLKPFRKNGYFLFGNHTLMGGDAFLPNMAVFPKKAYVVVHSANLATFGTKHFILMNGAIPLPTTTGGMRAFLGAISTRIEQGACVVIYPEAHVWPYYTKIRNFGSASFAYPVRTNAPIFTSTVTYKKRKYSEKPRITVYIDGPFFPDETLPPVAAREKLRDEAYYAMSQSAKNSDYEYYTYVKQSHDTEESQ